MKKALAFALVLFALVGTIVYAQTVQADVTVSITLKAVEVTALKNALIASGSAFTPTGIGARSTDVGDIIDGTYTITDANIQAWIKKQIKQQVDATQRQYRESIVRQAQPDVSAMTPEQVEAYLAFLRTIKK
jgi:hypothetical protein